MGNDYMDIDVSSDSQNSVDLIPTTPPTRDPRGTPKPFTIKSSLPNRRDTTSSSPPSDAALTPTPVPKSIRTSQIGLSTGAQSLLPSHEPKEDKRHEPQQTGSEPNNVYSLVDDFLSTAPEQKKPRTGHPVHIRIPARPNIGPVHLEPFHAAENRPSQRPQDDVFASTFEDLRRFSEINQQPQNALVSGPDHAPPRVPVTPSLHVESWIEGLQRPPQPKRLIIAISGPASAGKTTIAKFLQQVLQFQTPAHILHQDDFRKPDERCPPCTWPSPSRRGIGAYRALRRQVQSDRDAAKLWDINAGVNPKDIYDADQPRRYAYCWPSHGVKVGELMDARYARDEDRIQHIWGRNRHVTASYDWPLFMNSLAVLRSGAQNGEYDLRYRALLDDATRQQVAMVRHFHDALHRAVAGVVSQNRRCGFPGRHISTATGLLGEVGIVEGSMLYLPPGSGAEDVSTEAIAKLFDLKLFLSTTKREVRKRYFRGYAEVANCVNYVPQEIPATEPYFEGVIW